jgi:hypothetical protein
LVTFPKLGDRPARGLLLDRRFTDLCTNNFVGDPALKASGPRSGPASLHRDSRGNRQHLGEKFHPALVVFRL